LLRSFTMRKVVRRLLLASLAFALVMGGLVAAAAIRVRREFSGDALRARVVSALARELDSDVTLDSLDLEVFPLLRLHGAGLTIVPHAAASGGRIPAIEARQFTVKPGWRNMLQGRAGHVDLEGLRVTVLPRTSGAPASDKRPEPAGLGAPGPHRVPIDHLTARDSEVIFVRSQPGQPPRVYTLHDMSLDGVSADSVMRLRATLTNPVPRGRIAIDGHLGPWNAAAPGETVIDGDYRYADADFDTIDGLGGTLASTGHFSGPLTRLVVEGTTKMPDFQLDRGGHGMPLATVFHATVDTSNGNVKLDSVEATLGHSLIRASGSVTTTPGLRGHLIAMAVSVPNGRVEDMLMLSLPAPRPVLTGVLTMSTDLRLAPGQGGVIDRLQLSHGRFSLTGGTFTAPEFQTKLNALSGRGLGRSASEPAPPVTAAFAGKFELASALLSLPEFTLVVPGARVGLSGRYQLRAGTMEFDGDLRLTAHLSRAAGGGMKSFFLSAFDPMFQKPGSTEGATVPIRITGTHEHPAFKVDLRRLLNGK
jgi:hypothetical protein